MTKIKFCGLSRRCDIEAVNELKPGIYRIHVCKKTSKRYVSFEKRRIKKPAGSKDQAVGVFVVEINCLLVAGVMMRRTLCLHSAAGSVGSVTFCPAELMVINGCYCSSHLMH